MRIIILFFLSFQMIGCFAQALSKDEAIEDLTFLTNNLEIYNPALEIYNPNFKKEAQTIITSVKDSLELLEHFQLVSQIAALGNEGHTNVGGWDDPVHSGFISDTYLYMPLSVLINAGRLYVTDSYTATEDINPFDEIISINGQPSAAINKKLFKHIPSDGAILSNLEKKASAGFPWMYYVFIEQPSNFEIELRKPGSDTRHTVTVNALPRLQQRKNYKIKNQISEPDKKVESIDDFYTLQLLETHAILTLKTFDYNLVDTYNIKAKKFYGKVFEKIHASGVQHLIIDLRNNNGGRNEFADEFLPFVQQTEADPFLKKSVSWKNKVKTYPFPKKNKKVYSGKIYVLINGMTYSAGATLARYLKEYGNAITIGEESGSRYEGYVAGSSQAVFLPNSNLKIGIPRYHTYYPVSKKQLTRNQGLLPDIEIVPSITNLKNDEDIVLQKAIELTKQ